MSTSSSMPLRMGRPGAKEVVSEQSTARTGSARGGRRGDEIAPMNRHHTEDKRRNDGYSGSAPNDATAWSPFGRLRHAPSGRIVGHAGYGRHDRRCVSLHHRPTYGAYLCCLRCALKSRWLSRRALFAALLTAASALHSAPRTSCFSSSCRQSSLVGTSSTGSPHYRQWRNFALDTCGSCD